MLLTSDSPLNHKLIKKHEMDYIVEETQQTQSKMEDQNNKVEFYFVMIKNCKSLRIYLTINYSLVIVIIKKQLRR